MKAIRVGSAVALPRDIFPGRYLAPIVLLAARHAVHLLLSIKQVMSSLFVPSKFRHVMYPQRDRRLGRVQRTVARIEGCCRSW